MMQVEFQAVSKLMMRRRRQEHNCTGNSLKAGNGIVNGAVDSRALQGRDGQSTAPRRCKSMLESGGQWQWNARRGPFGLLGRSSNARWSVPSSWQGGCDVSNREWGTFVLKSDLRLQFHNLNSLTGFLT